MNEEEKIKFVNGLSELYINSTNNPFDFTSIEYEPATEHLHIHNNLGFFLVSVWGDNTHAILKDFCNFLKCPSDYKFVYKGEEA